MLPTSPAPQAPAKVRVCTPVLMLQTMPGVGSAYALSQLLVSLAS
jgi:hypothetical protein